MQKNQKIRMEAKKQPSGVKKLVFGSMLLLIPFVLLFLLELSLRIVSYGERYELFVNFPGKELKEHLIVNPVIGKKYFSKLEFTNPSHDMFLKQKPKNGFRIFVLGSSTALGFPYDENLMFTRILEERLQDSYPERHVEVINTALTAINSFTLLDFTDEILAQEPDAILIYAGHNEFYGAMGVGSVEKTFSSHSISLLHCKLLKFRIYQLIRNLIAGIVDLRSGDNTNHGVKGSLMKVIARSEPIPYKEEVYNRGIEIYEKNVSKILQQARRKKVPVFISELVSNVKDLEPFCSTVANKNPLAIDVYKAAVESEKSSDFDLARTNYDYAKDLDCIRFRASEDINEVVRKLAEEHNATMVAMKASFFEEVSPNKIIGENLLTEHVHPNIEGYFLMADAFFFYLAESKLLGEKLNIVHYKKSEYYKKNWGYTELDSLLGMHRVNSVKFYWPFTAYDAEFVDYREIYKPISFIDSLAFLVLKSPENTTNEAHLVMAEYYKERGDFYNAFREYHAAIKCNPYRTQDYLEAINCLLKNNDLALALKFANESLKLQQTSYAYFVKAGILIIKGEYEAAKEALLMAQKFDRNNEYTSEISNKFYELYYYSGNTEKSKEVLNEIRKTHPEFQAILPEKPVYVQNIPVQVAPAIWEAVALYRAGSDDAALKILLSSLETKETPLANRVIGDILMRKGDKNSVLYYLKAYPDYKNNLEFLYDLGSLYVSIALRDKALEILREMKKLNPEAEKTELLEAKVKSS